MAREIAKAYEPQQIEPRWAEYWVKEELFKADPSAPGPVFSIVIPPPNVTGSLHIGHMLEHTEIDILTRCTACGDTTRCICRERTMQESRRNAWWSNTLQTKGSITRSWSAKNLRSRYGNGRKRRADKLRSR